MGLPFERIKLSAVSCTPIIVAIQLSLSLSLSRSPFLFLFLFLPPSPFPLSLSLSCQNCSCHKKAPCGCFCSAEIHCLLNSSASSSHSRCSEYLLLTQMCFFFYRVGSSLYVFLYQHNIPLGLLILIVACVFFLLWIIKFSNFGGSIL